MCHHGNHRCRHGERISDERVALGRRTGGRCRGQPPPGRAGARDRNGGQHLGPPGRPGRGHPHRGRPRHGDGRRWSRSSISTVRSWTETSPRPPRCPCTPASTPPPMPWPSPTPTPWPPPRSRAPTTSCPHCTTAAWAWAGAPRTAAYATFGSQELADNVIEALKGRNAAMMQNHGSVAYGSTMAEAIERLELLEWLAELYWRASLAGNAPRADRQGLRGHHRVGHGARVRQHQEGLQGLRTCDARRRSRWTGSG